MADLGELDRSGSTKIAGSDSTGLEDNFMNVDSNGNAFVIDYADGPVTPGTVAAKSNLIGGQFNTVLPTLTNTQQAAVQVDSSGRVIIAPTTQGILAEDHNYGTVGASTLRTASQIGNSTGAADFNAGNSSAQTLRVVVATNQAALPVSQSGAWTVAATQSGTWTTGRTWTLASGTDSVAAVQSGTWTVQPGNTANTTPWLVTDSSDGPVGAGTAAGKSSLAGGVFNTVLPTLTNGQQAALQLDSSGRLIISSVASGLLAEDHNYGTVGANTLRTASQIGNATGAALFGAGTTTAQVLRVVLPTDQTAIPVTQSGTWNTGRTWTLSSGTDSILAVQSGTWTVQQGTPPWTIQGDSASGASKAGNPVQVGGVFNTTQPTVTTGQTVEAQSTARGALIVSTGVDAFNINNISGTISLPTGAATSALQTTGNTSLNSIDTKTPALGQALAAASVPVVLTAAQLTTLTPLSTVAVTQSTSPWITKDQSDGPVTPGAVASFSQLMGGQFNTALPTLTNTQQSAIQLDSSGRLIVSPTTQGVLAEDHNYGTVGANTLRTASQIGNSTGAADFAAGNSSAQTLRVVIATNQAVLTVQGDAASGASKAGNPVQIGGVFNTTQPTVTTGQAVEAQSTARGALIVATGVDTFTVKDSNFPTTVDTNYGTVGASTLRTASQVGNASGAADFNTGATGAQTLRVQANQGAAGASAWLTTDAADGPVTPGTVASKSILIGGQFNTTLPTLTTGQQSALQTDSSGRLLIVADFDDVKPATVNITIQDTASTTTAIANGQSAFTGTPTTNSAASFALDSLDTVVVEVTGVWTGTLQIEVSMDGGTVWYIRPIHQAGGSSAASFGSFTANFAGGLNVGAWTNVRVRAIAAMTGTATVRVVESINPNSIYVANAIRLVDSSGDLVNITPNNDLNVADIINTSGQYRAQSVTTSAAEALGAGSILVNRKSLTVTPTNGTVYWGFSNAVTTSTGTPIFKNQTMSWAIGSALHVYLIAGSTVDCRITEGS